MALLFIPSLVYGQEVMRGVIQEKTDRVVEILVSSMTPMELLSGKILGMAAVGLTQMAVWMTMGGLLLGSGLSQAQAAGLDLSTVLRPSVAVWFVVFFLLSYLVTVGAYAAGGAIVSSEKEAQQVLTPVDVRLHGPVVPDDADPDEPRLDPLGRPLARPDLHADDDVHPDPRLRAAGVAGRPLPRPLGRRRSPSS